VCDRAVAERLTQLTRVTPRSTPPLPPLAPSRSTARVAELHDAHGAPVATLACDVEIGAVVLGRGRTARVRIADERVSRAHASLTWEPTLGAHVLRDLQSANGTVLDGRRVEWPITLYDGAQLRIGNTELRYRLAGA
jgi:predicted component of type VI protein secretion system